MLRVSSAGAMAGLPAPVAKAMRQPGGDGQAARPRGQLAHHIACEREAGAHQGFGPRLRADARRDEQVLGIHLRAVAREVEEHRGVGRRGAHLGGKGCGGGACGGLVEIEPLADFEAALFQRRAQVAHVFVDGRQVFAVGVVAVADQQRQARRFAGGQRLRLHAAAEAGRLRGRGAGAGPLQQAAALQGGGGHGGAFGCHGPGKVTSRRTAARRGRGCSWPARAGLRCPGWRPAPGRLRR